MSDVILQHDRCCDVCLCEMKAGSRVVGSVVAIHSDSIVRSEFYATCLSCAGIKDCDHYEYECEECSSRTLGVFEGLCVSCKARRAAAGANWKGPLPAHRRARKEEVAKAFARGRSCWRQGSQVGKNLYIGDEDVGRMNTNELAAQVVDAMNEHNPARAWDRMLAERDAALGMLRECMTKLTPSDRTLMMRADYACNTIRRAREMLGEEE